MNRSNEIGPRANEANPYMIVRKTMLMSAKKNAVDIFAQYRAMGGERSIATVREVILGAYRNDTVIDAFCLAVGINRKLAFPDAELDWIAEHRRAVRAAVEAAS